MLVKVSLNDAPPISIQEFLTLIDLESNLARVSPHAPAFAFRWTLATDVQGNSDDAWFALLAGNGHGEVTPAAVTFTLHNPATRVLSGTYDLTDAVVSDYAEEDTGNQVVGRCTLRAKTVTYTPAGGGDIVVYPAVA